MSNTSDEELLAAWRAGAPKAGHELFDRYCPQIQRFFEFKVDCDTTDLIQKTFLGLLESRDRFRGDASFRTLIFAIARNQLYTHLRNVNRDRARFEPDEVSLADLGTSPTGALAARETRLHLIRALRELPLEAQLMVELHYWQGLQLKEIAVIFGVPAGTLRQRLSRARARLEQLLERFAHEPEAQLTLTRLSAWAERVEAEDRENRGYSLNKDREIDPRERTSEKNLPLA